MEGKMRSFVEQIYFSKCHQAITDLLADPEKTSEGRERDSVEGNDASVIGGGGFKLPGM